MAKRRGRPRKRYKRPRSKQNPKDWSYTKIRKYSLKAAENPNSKYMKELEKYAYRLARKANKQLAALKKNNATEWAYASSRAWTERMYGTTRYKTKGLTPEMLRLQTFAAQRYLNMPTSTVEGYNLTLMNKRNSFRVKYPEFASASDDEIDEFLRLLGNDSVRLTIKEARRSKGGSGKIVDLIRGMWENKDEVRDEIVDAFTRYRVSLGSLTMHMDNQEVFGYDDLINYLSKGKK